VRGAHVAPLGTLAFRVGPAVRISFAPAESLQIIGSTAAQPIGVISGSGYIVREVSLFQSRFA
jgi:hypothetical protein